MGTPPRVTDSALEPALVSTGRLPTPRRVQQLVAEAHERYRGDAGGATSNVYPALAQVAPELFGICVIGMSGSMYAAGDARSTSRS